MIKGIFTTLTLTGALCISSAASAALVFSNGANDTLATAQNVNGFFDLSFNAQIANSTTIPHVEITNFGPNGGGGDNTFDHYFFSVAEDNTTAIFDIDCGNQTLGLPNIGCTDRDDDFDSWLTLFTGAGALITTSDDSAGTDPGSENDLGFLDSLLELTLDQGDYIVRVEDFFNFEIPDGASYILNVSLDSPRSAAPAPSVVFLLGIALAGLGVARRR